VRQPFDVRDSTGPADTGTDDDSGTGGQADRTWMKLAGLGMELAATTLGTMAIGYLIDRYRAAGDNYVTAAAALVGFAFGMFRFIQKARQAGTPSSR